MADAPEIIYDMPPDGQPVQPPRGPPRPKPQRLWLHIGLFLLTLASATYSQLPSFEGDTLKGFLLRPFLHPALLAQSLPFALTLMAILLAHEMGHFVTARRLGVDQSLPYFIPAPTIFGTFGAVILMRSQPQNRRALLYVAVMGPFAGLLVALPAAAWGLRHSLPIDVSAPEVQGALMFGDSLLFAALEALFSPNGPDVALHPVGLAGWVGLFITSLNLIPAAQLDGGHVSYALFGRQHEKIGLLIVCTMLFFGLHSALLEHGSSGGSMWILWAVLLFMLGLRHPPVRDERMPLSRGQRACGLLALLLFAVTFIPKPISLLDGAGEPAEMVAPGGEDEGGGGSSLEEQAPDDCDDQGPPVEEYNL